MRPGGKRRLAFARAPARSRRVRDCEGARERRRTTENTVSNREYLREEQRSQTGCSAARMQMELRDALLVLRIHGPSDI
jgi:hypothetical protein